MSTNPFPNPPTPLGTLIALPPELRANIYHHLLDRSYLVCWTSPHTTTTTTNTNNNNSYLSPANLAIRCVSKTLSAEASARLFSFTATTFAFLIAFDDPHARLSPPPLKSVTDMMMNVEFVVDTGVPFEREYISVVERGMQFLEEEDMGDDDIIPMVTARGDVRGRQTLYYPAAMLPRCEGSVDHFTGGEVERNSLLIAFRDFDVGFRLFMATRFFRRLKLCVGFRRVTVVLARWEMDGVGFDGTGMVEEVEEVRGELESCWGPGVVEDVLGRYRGQGGLGDTEMCFAFQLAFQPRKFHGENLKAEAAGVVKGGDRMEEVS